MSLNEPASFQISHVVKSDILNSGDDDDMFHDCVDENEDTQWVGGWVTWHITIFLCIWDGKYR